MKAPTFKKHTPPVLLFTYLGVSVYRLQTGEYQCSSGLFYVLSNRLDTIFARISSNHAKLTVL
jgi:hypothetical protein